MTTDPHFPHAPEFSRRIPVSRLGTGGLDQTIEASAAERRALAERLQLPAVASFTCRFQLSPPKRGRISAEAELRAEVTQVCVVTLEPFEATVSERFTLLFVPEPSGVESSRRITPDYAANPARDDGEANEIDPDLPDELVYEGDVIDIGEAASEQLALALDPYPRMPGIAAPLEFDDESDTASDDIAGGPQGAGGKKSQLPSEKPNPFAALARLRGGSQSGDA